MHIIYAEPRFAHSIDSIMPFQTDAEAPYWSDALYYFYPQLDAERMGSLSHSEKARYISEVLRGVYSELAPSLKEKAEAYNAHWADRKKQVNAALTDAFKVDVPSLFNDLKGYITLNPVCPRFLTERYFDVFYLNSPRGALGISIHEMIHFVWFHVWHSIRHDDYSEYERPYMKWILSEMVVESIMRDSRLSSINPYFPRENGGCVYGYFQDMIIEGRPILDTIDEMYRALSIVDFMDESYKYCLKNEPAILAHIEKSEAAF